MAFKEFTVCLNLLIQFDADFIFKKSAVKIIPS